MVLKGDHDAELKSCCPVSCDDAMMANIWATLVVIELLKKKYPSMLDELELVIMKAEQWLSKQVLPSGINLTTMRESAEKVPSRLAIYNL